MVAILGKFLETVQNLKATRCAHWVCPECYFWSSNGSFGLSSARNHRFGPCAHAPHSRPTFVHKLTDSSLPPATRACERSAPAPGSPAEPPAGLNGPAGRRRQQGCTPKPPQAALLGRCPESPARRGPIRWGLSSSEGPNASTRPGPGRPGHWLALWGKPAPPHQIGPERPF